MNIEILDSQGGVLTRVANSGNPDRDVADYGGTSWREYVEPDAVRINRKRKLKIKLIRSEALSRLQSIDSVLSQEFVERLLWMASQNILDLSTPGTEATQAQQTVNHAKTKIADMNTADEATIDSYDPATDPGWPV